MPVVLTNKECPFCKGSDSVAIYKNKDESSKEDFLLFKCFSAKCESKPIRLQTTTPSEYFEELANGATPMKEQPITGLLPFGNFIDLKDTSFPWGSRGLDAQVCSYFNVTVNPAAPLSQRKEDIISLMHKGEPTTGPALIFPYEDDKGNIIAQKVRTSMNKKGSWYKRDDNAIKRIGFFGQNLWKSNAIRDIIITFGELDALAVYQMIGQPVVSVSNGDGSAPAQFKAQYSWLQRFNNIILIPDNDESCRAVIPLLGAIFPRKTRVVNLTKHKDPNDYLVNGDRDSFVAEFYASQPFSPEKIISLGSLKALLFEDPPKPIATYPWEGLTAMTGGVWPGELITVKAPPKVGKTTFFTEIASHLYNTTNKPIGLIYLEETQRDLIFRFVSIKLNRNLQRIDILATTPPEELEQAGTEFVNDDRIFIVDHWGSCSSDFLEDKIKEFVLAKNCQFIFFDHVSMAITDESNKDERIALDRLISSIKELTIGIPDEESWIDPATDELKTKVVLRQPTIFMITHVNDNGQPRGSRIALQVSNLVIGLKRDKLSSDTNVRNTLEMWVEENRRYGETGRAGVLSYNSDTSRLMEVPMLDSEGQNND